MEGGRHPVPVASLRVKDNLSNLFESQPFPGLLSGWWEGPAFPAWVSEVSDPRAPTPGPTVECGC